MKIISGKTIFAFLIIIIIISFIINIFLYDNINSKNILLNQIPINKNKDKILGVKIRQQSKKGEKFLIVAESLIERNSDDKNIYLENSLTTIEQNGIFTNISAGYAIISNNYDNFKFSDKVIITKKIRRFVLKTESLAGTFEKGNYYTDDDVDITSNNIRIKGSGLEVIKNGEYIKIKGKAKLNMLFMNNNDK